MTITSRKRSLIAAIELVIGSSITYMMVRLGNGHTTLLQPAYGFLLIVGIGGGWLSALALRSESRRSQALAAVLILVSLSFCIDALRLLALANTFQMNIR